MAGKVAERTGQSGAQRAFKQGLDRLAFEAAGGHVQYGPQQLVRVLLAATPKVLRDRLEEILRLKGGPRIDVPVQPQRPLQSLLQSVRGLLNLT